MPKYQVNISKQIVASVEIPANSEEQAVERVEWILWHSGPPCTIELYLADPRWGLFLLNEDLTIDWSPLKGSLEIDDVYCDE